MKANLFKKCLSVVLCLTIVFGTFAICGTGFTPLFTTKASAFGTKEQTLKDFIINDEYIEIIVPNGGSTGGYQEPDCSFNVYDFDGDNELELVIQTVDFHIIITSVFKVINNQVKLIAEDSIYKSSYSYLVKGDKYHGFVCPALHQSYGPGICVYFSMDGSKTAFQREYDSKGNFIGYNFDEADEIDDELLDLLMDEDENGNNDNLMPLYFFKKDEIESMGWDEFFNPTWSRAYYDFYESGEYTEEFIAGNNLSAGGNDPDGPKLGLKDLNNDGFPELLVGDPWETGRNGHGYIYTYKNNKVEYIGYSGSYGGEWWPHAVSSKNYPGVFTYNWKGESGYPNEMPFHITYYEYDGTGINTIDVCANYSNAGEYERITDNIGLYNAIVNKQEPGFELTYLKDIFFDFKHNVDSIEWGGFIAKYSKYFLLTSSSLSEEDVVNACWDEFLSGDSKTYSKNIALMSTYLCEAANSAYQSGIENKYSQYGITDIIACNYGNIEWLGDKDFWGSSAYTIGYKDIDGTVILCVTARGTTSVFEGAGDFLKGGDIDLPDVNEKIYKNIYDFEEEIWSGLLNYVSAHNNFSNYEKIIINITGHSLGGAAVNALTARINHYIKTTSGSWFDKLSQDKVFSYTLGGIKTLTTDSNLTNGYENIHNIYNFFDTFGPFGSKADWLISSPGAKFGHTDYFMNDYDESNDPYANHAVSNYRDAIEKNLVYGCYDHSDVPDRIDSFSQEFWHDGHKGTVDLSFDSYWFTSNNYNHKLCQFASKFAMLGYDQGGREISDGLKFPNELCRALNKLGFYYFEFNNNTSRDEVNYFIAKRTVNVHNKNYNLVFMGLIGTNKEQWESDFDSGYDKDSDSAPEIHEGFNNALNYSYNKLSEYVSRNGLESENTIILLTGHSRGAAAANLLAAKLILANDSYGSERLAAKNKVFAYTFATPNNIKNSSEVRSSRYENIYNIVNPEDFVTKCMPNEWGYTRYGTTITLPSQTNDKNYYKYLNRIEEKYNQYCENGRDYNYYYFGEKTVYDIVKKMTSAAINEKEYYKKNFKVGPISEGDLHNFFIGNVAKAAENNFLAIGSLLSFTSNPFCDVIFKDIANFFIDNYQNNCFGDAHLAQTYCAFVSSMTERELCQKREAYIGEVNCPVDVEIFDKDSGELVGKIKNNIVDKKIAAKPNSIVMSVYGDSKSFWLPSNGNYQIKLTGNDNGAMDYTLAETDSNTGEKNRVNFFNVTINNGKSWTGETSENNFSITNHTLKSDNGTVLNKTEEIYDASKKFAVLLNSDGNGFVSGPATAVSGDCVTVEAAPDNGYSFSGWYENGKLVSSSAKYSFVVKSNRTLTAKFIEGSLLSNVGIYVGGAITVERRSTLGLSYFVENIPLGYYVRMDIYQNGKCISTDYYDDVFISNGATVRNGEFWNQDGSSRWCGGTKYLYDVEPSVITYKVSLCDSNGVIVADDKGNEISKESGKITVKDVGFFKRIVLFFKALFRRLPTVYIKAVF